MRGIKVFFYLLILVVSFLLHCVYHGSFIPYYHWLFVPASFWLVCMEAYKIIDFVTPSHCHFPYKWISSSSSRECLAVQIRKGFVTFKICSLCESWGLEIIVDFPEWELLNLKYWSGYLSEVCYSKMSWHASEKKTGICTYILFYMQICIYNICIAIYICSSLYIYICKLIYTNMHRREFQESHQWY
jgi:hypothetical protein